MKNHDLKIEKAYLEALESGEKKCEIRYNDRDFQVGEVIWFFVMLDKKHVNKQSAAGPYKITHVLSWLGLREGYVALSLERIDDEIRIPHGNYTLDVTVAGPDEIDPRDLPHSRHVIETPEELDTKIDSRPVGANRISEEDVPF